MKRGVIAAALLVAAGGCARVDPDAAAVAAAADGFLAAQRDGAWPRAFESLHVNLRRRCDSVEALRAAADAAATIPLSWTLDPPSVAHRACHRPRLARLWPQSTRLRSQSRPRFGEDAKWQTHARCSRLIARTRRLTSN